MPLHDLLRPASSILDSTSRLLLFLHLPSALFLSEYGHPAAAEAYCASRLPSLKAESAGAVPHTLGIEVELSVTEYDEDGDETEMGPISAENAKCLGLALISFGMPELHEILENGALGTHGWTTDVEFE